jgi:hypothetical protein
LTSALAASDRQRRPLIEDLRVEAGRALVAAGGLFELAAADDGVEVDEAVWRVRR